MSDLHIRKFAREDFFEYKSWFSDVELNKALGPMDDEWLEQVMNMTDGVELSAFLDGILVAVFGLKLPTTEYPDFYLTDLAVKPDSQGRGIGSKVLEELLKKHPVDNQHKWITFVDERNPKARGFFEKNGWKCQSEISDESGMFRLVLERSF